MKKENSSRKTQPSPFRIPHPPPHVQDIYIYITRERKTTQTLRSGTINLCLLIWSRFGSFGALIGWRYSSWLLTLSSCCLKAILLVSLQSSYVTTSILSTLPCLEVALGQTLACRYGDKLYSLIWSESHLLRPGSISRLFCSYYLTVALHSCQRKWFPGSPAGHSFSSPMTWILLSRTSSLSL